MRWNFIFEVLCSVAHAEVHCYQSDHLGSTVLILDEDRKITQHSTYFPFGEILAPHPNPLPKGERAKGEGVHYFFTSQELDREADLFYYGARYYDPTLSRFVSVDPLMDGMNAYAYVGNHPTLSVDSTGKAEENPDFGELRTCNGLHCPMLTEYLEFTGPELSETPVTDSMPDGERWLKTWVDFVSGDIGDLKALITGETVTGEEVSRFGAGSAIIFGTARVNSVAFDIAMQKLEHLSGLQRLGRYFHGTSESYGKAIGKKGFRANPFFTGGDRRVSHGDGTLGLEGALKHAFQKGVYDRPTVVVMRREDALLSGAPLSDDGIPTAQVDFKIGVPAEAVVSFPNPLEFQPGEVERFLKQAKEIDDKYVRDLK